MKPHNRRVSANLCCHVLYQQRKEERGHRSLVPLSNGNTSQCRPPKQRLYPNCKNFSKSLITLPKNMGLYIFIAFYTARVTNEKLCLLYMDTCFAYGGRGIRTQMWYKYTCCFYSFELIIVDSKYWCSLFFYVTIHIKKT